MKRRNPSQPRVRAVLLIALAAASCGLAAAREKSEPAHPLIGASVVGPSTNEIGTIRDVVIDRRTGEPAMYLVKAHGWFEKLGVIPLSAVEGQTAFEGEGGGVVSVTVNAATFENIAKWDGEGPVGRYLSGYRSILATVYGLDAAMLENPGDRYHLATRAAEAELAAARTPRAPR